MRRATKLRASLVKRRTVVIARLDAYLELMSPAWHGVFGAHTSSNTPLRFLTAGYADPYTLRRLGQARLVKFLWRHSRGAWGVPQLTQEIHELEQRIAVLLHALDPAAILTSVPRVWAINRSWHVWGIPTGSGPWPVHFRSAASFLRSTHRESTDDMSE